jgi:flagellar biosynthesis/type III secretory pathway protein FliH
MLFEFGTAKLLDWRDRITELESSDNPFATVVMTHLKVIETKRNVENRKAWKFSLTRALYDKGYERQQILDLYRFIDWIMILPEPIEREFWQELQTFEEERKVTYVTHAERFGFERGVQEGRQEGRQEGELAIVLRLLTRRFDRMPESVQAQIESLSVSGLERLSDALLDFTSLADLHAWLNSHA